MLNHFDIRINIATPNGTGSLTANKLLTKILIKNGLSASSKNLFPSNIAGLPTWYNIRVNSDNYLGFKDNTDLYIGFNKSTFVSDIEELSNDTYILTNKDFKFADERISFEIPIREITKPLCDSPSLRKLISNIVYVGFLAKLFDCSLEDCLDVCKSHLKKRSQELIDLNFKAFEKGFESCPEPLFFLEKNKTQKDYLIDGNSAAALGFLDGGASVVTWYPITPSSSLVESFDKFNRLSDNQKNVSVLQAEDEISAAVSVLGAGWSGARAFTATSGPGLSLMQESIGLGYFAEIPLVIADVQRAGPSTGLPTRTAQGDLLTAHYSSHGDSIHPVLLPSNIQELYDDSFLSLNLAENLQTPVFLMSDLDLGMNDWPTDQIKRQKCKINKGKVATKPSENFKRFSFESDLPERSLPRISDSSLAYFTRGSGHDESGNYSENPDVYQNKLLKLKNKILNNRDSTLFPKDIFKLVQDAEISLIYYGSTTQIVEEIISLLKIPISIYQVRALPVSNDLYTFAKKYKSNFVIEQNRDGQVCKIIKSTSDGENFKSLAQFNGLPASANYFVRLINEFFSATEIQV